MFCFFLVYFSAGVLLVSLFCLPEGSLNVPRASSDTILPDVVSIKMLTSVERPMHVITGAIYRRTKMIALY